MKKILTALAIAVAFVVGFSLQPVYGPITPPALDDRNFGGVIGFLQTQIDEINNAGFLTAGDSFFDVFVRQTDLDFLRDRANLAEHLANDNDLDPTNELNEQTPPPTYWEIVDMLGDQANAFCDVGDKIIGGGTTVLGGQTEVTIGEPIFNGGPNSDQEGWKGGLAGGGSFQIRVSASCLDLIPLR